MKLLVVTSEPISADRLRAAIGDRLEAAEVMVVAPALHRSALRFWLSDADEAIAEAEKVQRQTVEDLARAGIDATGDTGDSDPFEAIADALTTLEADRLLVFTHPGDRSAYRETVTAEQLRERFGIPVDEDVVTAPA